MKSSRGLVVLLAISLVGCEAALARFERSEHWQKEFFVQAKTFDVVIAEDVSLMATDQGFFYAGEDGRYRRSSSLLPRNANIVAYGYSSKRWDIYAVTEYGHLLRSTDRGRKFVLIGEFPSIQVYDMTLTGGGQLFVASSSGLLVSDLDEESVGSKAEARTHFLPWEMLVMALPIWRRANLGADTDPWHDWSVVLPGNVFRVASDPYRHGHVVAEVLDEGAYRSWNMGSSWEPVYTEDGARARGPVAFGPNQRVLIGMNYSEDGGETFRILKARTDMTMEKPSGLRPGSTAVTEDGLWIVDADAGSVFRSGDGVRWARIGSPIDFYATKGKRSATVLSVDHEGNVWVGTDGHGLFRHVK